MARAGKEWSGWETQERHGLAVLGPEPMDRTGAAGIDWAGVAWWRMTRREREAIGRNGGAWLRTKRRGLETQERRDWERKGRDWSGRTGGAGTGIERREIEWQGRSGVACFGKEWLRRMGTDRLGPESKGRARIGRTGPDGWERPGVAGEVGHGSDRAVLSRMAGIGRIGIAWCGLARKVPEMHGRNDGNLTEEKDDGEGR